MDESAILPPDSNDPPTRNLQQDVPPDEQRELIRHTRIFFMSGEIVSILVILGVLVQSQVTTNGVFTEAQRAVLIISTCFAATFLILYFWLVLYRLTSLRAPKDEDGRGRTSRVIAFFVMAAFIIGLSATFAGVIYGPRFTETMPETAKSWLDIFRNGFVLLGTALTTIIGYYFGARQAENAQRQLDIANRQLTEVLQSPESRSLRRRLNPDDSSAPDST